MIAYLQSLPKWRVRRMTSVGALKPFGSLESTRVARPAIPVQDQLETTGALQAA
jgi:hypothetical protein